MFFFSKVKEDDSSPDSSTGKPPPLLRRHDTFGSAELFEAWAKDSFINQSTIDILVKTHQIDCLPAVLALKKEDYPQLNLPVGQRRLLEDAVEKLRQEYELVRPPTPKAIINLEMPVYKSMLEIGELAEEDTRASGTDDRGQFQEEVPISRAQSGFVSQRKLGQASGFVDSGKEKRDSKPENATLLDTEQKKLSPETAQRRKDGSKSSPRQSQACSETKSYHDEGDDDGDEYTACACQRWMFVTIFMPIFVVLSILGFVFVLLLMPFRLCCPQGGVFTNVLTFLFEVFIMAPCLACKWASGKGKQQANWTAGSKPRYGGTDDVELGDK